MAKHQKQLLLPDELIDQVKTEADSRHMNFTQYTIRALQQMVEADRLLRSQPEINRKIAELTEMLSQVATSQK